MYGVSERRTNTLSASDVDHLSTYIHPQRFIVENNKKSIC